MIEIEVKGRINNEKEFEKRIKEIGASFLGEEHHIDIYFSHPCRDFKQSDEALRIRVKNSYYEITYKGRKIDSKTKTREEITARVYDLENMIRILNKLGFSTVAKIVKHRKKYIVDNFVICIDNVENLGKFVEIEEKSSKYEPSRILNFAKNLGINEILTKSYLELLMEGGK